MTERSTTELHAVEKLLRMLNDQRITIFDEEEAAALKSVAAYWIGLRSVGKLASGFRALMGWFGWVVLFWLAIKADILSWMHNFIGSR